MTSSWKKNLMRSIKTHEGDYTSNFFSLSSISAENPSQPRVRTVVFRGFRDDKIVFITGSRDKKIRDFNKNPNTEIVWYFSKTREQYRFVIFIYIILKASLLIEGCIILVE